MHSNHSHSFATDPQWLEQIIKNVGFLTILHGFFFALAPLHRKFRSLWPVCVQNHQCVMQTCRYTYTHKDTNLEMDIDTYIEKNR